MRRSSETARPRTLALALACALASACGGDDDAPPPGDAAAAAPTSPVVAAARAAGETATSGEPAAASPPGKFGPRELVNPDGSAVVFLYYHLSGLTPPYDRWVEADSRVTLAPPIERQAQREAVRAELEAAAAAVQGVGALRLTIQANLSDYDPSYGEFTVRGLAPSSVVEFSALQQKVSIRFANGLAAQTWSVPAEEAQLVRDKIGPMRAVSADTLLRITDVQPEPGGGTLTTEIVEYELREDRSGQRLARVRVAP